MRTEITYLNEIERCVSWIASWTIHHANHIRQGGEVKVGGHQASSASLSTIIPRDFQEYRMRWQETLTRAAMPQWSGQSLNWAGQGGKSTLSQCSWLRRRPLWICRWR